MTAYRTVRQYDGDNTPKLVKGDTIYLITVSRVRNGGRTLWTNYTHTTPRTPNGEKLQHPQARGWLGNTIDNTPLKESTIIEFAEGRATVVSIGDTHVDTEGNAYQPIKVRPNAAAPDTFDQVDDADGYPAIVRIPAGEVVTN